MLTGLAFHVARSRRRLQRRCLRGDEAGATAVEFALVGPIFLLLIFVIAELALLFLAEELMDRAINEAARMVRTGQVHAGNMNKQEFEAEVCRKLFILVDCKGPFYLDVKAYGSFAAMDSAPPLNPGGAFKGSGEADFGQPNDIVVVRAYYQWPTSPILGRWSLANLENGRRLIGSFAAFRNEPFPTSGRGATADGGTAAAAGPANAPGKSAAAPGGLQ